MAQHGLYQPKIADEHIRQLYQWAKRLQMPMPRLVNALLAHALTRLEQVAVNVEIFISLDMLPTFQGSVCPYRFFVLRAPHTMSG